MNQKNRYILSVLVTAYSSVVFGGCSEPQLDRWDEYFSSGMQAFKNEHYSLAEDRFSLSLKESQKYDPNHSRQVDSLEWLAKTCLRQGKLQQAESFCSQAVKISEASAYPSDWLPADRLTEVAEIYRSQRKYRQAEPLLRRALSIYENHFDENVIHKNGGNWTGVGLLATGFINLAAVLNEQKKNAEAQTLFRRGLKLLEADIDLSSDSPDAILDIKMQADLYREKKGDSQFESFLHKSLERTIGFQRGINVSIRLNNIAALYYAEGKYEQAEPLLKDSLKQSQVTGSERDPMYAYIEKNLAEVYLAQGKYKQAEPLLKSALDMTERTLGPDHPGVANILDIYAALLRKTKRPAEAEKLEARVKLIRTPQ